MGILTITREGLQVSQKAMSEYLSVSESLLKMIETNQRELSAKKMLMVLDLHNHLEPLQPLEALATVAPYQQAEQADLQPWLQEQISLLGVRQKQLQEQLEKQKVAYEKYLRAWHAFTEANAQPTGKTPLQQDWLKGYQHDIREKLEKNGQKARIQLEIKLAKVTQELEILVRYLS